MSSSENQIGFSTGAIGNSEILPAVTALRGLQVRAIELSALRRHELPALLSLLSTLDLSDFDYISVHAPSRFAAEEEEEIVHELSRLPAICKWIIVHPDVITDDSKWAPLDGRLTLENMDTRKPTGRNVGEMNELFARLPDARMCLDLAHAEKVDSTMLEAYEMIQRFGGRIVQVHLSEISTASVHHALSIQGLQAARRVAKLVRSTVPIILESPVDPAAIRGEIERALDLFRSALDDVKKDIDTVFRLYPDAPWRRRMIARHLAALQEPCDAGVAIMELPHGGPAARGQVFVSAWDMYQSLAPEERIEAERYFRSAVADARQALRGEG